MKSISDRLNTGYLSSRSGVSDETRSILADETFAEIVTFPRDTEIIEQGTRPEALYFTLSGVFHAVSHANPNASNRLLGRIQDGQFIGEVCLVDPEGKASATVKALREAKALKMKPDAFKRMREEHPVAALEFLMAVSRQLAQRLRDANERVF